MAARAAAALRRRARRLQRGRGEREQRDAPHFFRGDGCSAQWRARRQAVALCPCRAALLRVCDAVNAIAIGAKGTTAALTQLLSAHSHRFCTTRVQSYDGLSACFL
mmetsp:Transcript_17568/g.52286  ORF Transcript_17568/g.52286 Transcript_17568/m.52286 type:complete len:106 (+) Transcript_17568:590-907(+)